jgi:hypothetical protein
LLRTQREIAYHSGPEQASWTGLENFEDPILQNLAILTNETNFERGGFDRFHPTATKIAKVLPYPQAREGLIAELIRNAPPN